MKILIPIDGSPHSLVSLGAFLDRRDWFRDGIEVTLLYVHPPLPYQRAVAWAGHDAVHAYYDEESEAALTEPRKLLTDRGIAFACEKRVGDPAAEIIAHTADGKFDLVVMGTHGHTALVNLVLGSVATKVLAGSKVPVMFMK